MKSFLISLTMFITCMCIFINAQQPCNWTTQSTGITSVNTLDLKFAAINDNVCWAVNRANNQYIRTTNGGDQWTTSTIPNAPANWQGSYISAIDANTAWILMYEPGGPESGGVFKTTDGGNSWNQQTTAFSPNTGGFPKIIHFFNANDGVCIGNPNPIGYWEIYTTSNGGTNWNRVSQSNVPASTSSEVTFFWYSSSGNSIWFSGGDANLSAGRLFRSTNRGLNWEVFPLPDGGVAVPAFKDTQNGIVAHFVPSNKLFKTTNGGETWTEILPFNVPFTSAFISYAPGTPGGYMMVSAVYPGLVSTNGSAYTLDDGITWNVCDNSVSRGLLSDFADENTGWCGSSTNSVYRYYGPPLPVELVSFNSSVYGNNIQLNWQTATEINNQGFEVYRNGNKIAFVDGKGTTPETQDYSFIDKNLQSGIYNYRLKQTDFDGTQEVVGELTVYLTLPEQFSLEQNYPNPFNPTTTIIYSIPSTAVVTLNVYDVLGNEVATLVNEEKTAGSFEVNFNAADLSSGIYFYKLQAGNFIDTKKMILLR
jgi:photosystem II stability/assembly factor-like uncharacterized protein